MGQWPVVLHGPLWSFSGRVCAVRKNELAIRLAHRRLYRRSSKKQMSTRPETLEFAKYVLVFTTRSIGSTAEILQLYRMRWQIELAFKRMKSLAQLGHLPKHDGHSSCAWLYGKLFVALLAQKAIRIGRDISLGGIASALASHLARGANLVSCFIRCRMQLSRTSVSLRCFPLGMRSHELLPNLRARGCHNAWP